MDKMGEIQKLLEIVKFVKNVVSNFCKLGKTGLMCNMGGQNNKKQIKAKTTWVKD